MKTERIETFSLWENGLPGAPEREGTKIHYYHAADKKGDGCVIIFAGGGYRVRTAFEDDGYARYLNGLGLDAFVVDYRICPDLFPAPLCDARRAVRFVRFHAKKFGIDPHKVAVMGSSAGGHLAALVSTYRDPIEGENSDGIDGEDCIPDMQILCYPVIDLTSAIGHVGSTNNLLGENHSPEEARRTTPYLIADEKTPRAFFWHTSSDQGVNVMNSYLYASKLRELNKIVEMHIYPMGGHGLGLADEGNRNIPYVADWATQLARFLEFSGYFKKI